MSTTIIAPRTIRGPGIMATSGVTLRARLRAVSTGSLVTQASLSTITYAVRDLTDGTTDATSTLTISAVIFDSLQQADPTWRLDSAARPGADGAWGYNFRAALAGSLFADFDVESSAPYRVSSHDFQVDIEFTPVTGNSFVQSWSFPVYGAWV